MAACIAPLAAVHAAKGLEPVAFLEARDRRRLCSIARPLALVTCVGVSGWVGAA